MVGEIIQILFDVLVVLAVELVTIVLLYYHLVYLIRIVANLGILHVVLVAQLLAIGILGQLDPHDGVLAATQAVDLADSLQAWTLHLHDLGVSRVVLVEVLQLLLVECLRLEVHLLGIEATGDDLGRWLGLAGTGVHQGVLRVQWTQREAHLWLSADARVGPWLACVLVAEEEGVLIAVVGMMELAVGDRPLELLVQLHLVIKGLNLRLLGRVVALWPLVDVLFIIQAVLPAAIERELAGVPVVLVLG